jgi:hypothetical protein
MPENTITAFYDKDASEYLRHAAAWATLADTANSPEKEKYWAKSQEYFQRAIAALETAKMAANK